MIDFEGEPLTLQEMVAMLNMEVVDKSPLLGGKAAIFRPVQHDVWLAQIHGYCWGQEMPAETVGTCEKCGHDVKFHMRVLYPKVRILPGLGGYGITWRQAYDYLWDTDEDMEKLREEVAEGEDDGQHEQG